MRQLSPMKYEITVAGLFAGAGGMSLGLSQGHARIGCTEMVVRDLGGIDSWPLAVESYNRINNGGGILLDLFEEEDYADFHGKPIYDPKDRKRVIGWQRATIPAGWRPATPADVRAKFREAPDVLASSPPCKGLSGLLNALAAAGPKYQALNRLVYRGLALTLEAFIDDLPALILLENVPRIQTRGKDLLDLLTALLRGYGYSVSGEPHNCGELGGLGQNRERFLLVARNTKKVRPFLYEPPRQRVRSIGDVIGELAMPDDPALGPMHRIPRLTWQTNMRLALIKPGRDWRYLHELPVVDGYLRDLCCVPMETAWRNGPLGVKGWDQPGATVAGESLPTNGQFSVADPRPREQGWNHGVFGVQAWNDTSGAVTSRCHPSNGEYSIADPRLDCDASDKHGRRHNNVYKLCEWSKASAAVTAGTGPASGGLSVADPRMKAMGNHSGKMHVQDWEGPARTVTGVNARVGSGAQCIADPRFMHSKSRDGDWSGGGQYGVAQWDEPSKTVSAKAKCDTGVWTVADPRGLPAADDKPDPPPIIISLDGTWHRPLTTLELAMLQGYPLHLWDGSLISFAGKSDAKWREQIGNSVPPPAARAIGNVMAKTMLMEALDQPFSLTQESIWVQPLAAALSVSGEAANG